MLVSAANHNQLTHEETLDVMIKSHILGKKNGDNLIVYNGTWNSNFNSWKSFRSVNKYLLIKYEDLINDKEKEFYKILKFIHKLNKTEFLLNKEKFENVIDSTDFNKVKKLEEQKGFPESMVNNKTGEKVKFFNLGPNNNWKDVLNTNLKEKIEENFEKEMIELGYL